LVFFNTCTDQLLYVSEAAYTDGKLFTFIGLTHRFEKKIDWQFAELGKLWNYNLQYLHYLLDDSLEPALRKGLLQDISKELLTGRLPLEPYPVSLRIVNTLLFLQRTGIQDAEIEQALLQQIDYLDSNLEYHLLANHLLENIFALFIAAQYMRNERLGSKYTRRLLKELKEQILSDGGHYECTPMYQSILLSKLFLCIEVGSQSGLIRPAVIQQLKNTAAKMLGWMQAYSFPDGSWALFNDSAEGIAPTTAQLQAAAGSLNIAKVNVVLNKSGFRKISIAGGEMVVKTGGVQPDYQPGHTHADIGSFCLWYQGKQYIVDTGISTYSISEQRSWERNTSAHNTISVANINQSDVWGGFRVGRRAKVEMMSSGENAMILLIKGYNNSKVAVKRLFVWKGRAMRITDSIESLPKNYTGNVKASILFNSNLTLNKAGDGAVWIEQIRLTSSDCNFEICEAKMACQYNRLQSAKRIKYIINSSVNITLEFQ
jgi:hypothetical protein